MSIRKYGYTYARAHTHTHARVCGIIDRYSLTSGIIFEREVAESAFLIHDDLVAPLFRLTATCFANRNETCTCPRQIAIAL